MKKIRKIRILDLCAARWCSPAVRATVKVNGRAPFLAPHSSETL